MRKCNKITYETKEIAKEHVNIIKIDQRFRSKTNNKKGNGGKKLSPYLCPYCNGYHLTSQRKRKY